MTRRALVTGAAGFVGRWLLRELVGAGWQVVGAGLAVAEAKGVADEALSEVSWKEADFRQLTDVKEVLDQARPDLIVHLAGVAYLPAAAADPGTAYEINVAATGRLLGELRTRRAAGALDPVTLVIGSAEQYGRHDAARMPLDENAEQRPLNVYAASKSAQEIVALEAARSAGLRVVCTRSFNHAGPGQAPNFVLPALVGRALALRGKAGGMLPVGNLTPVRDYLHVRDVATAYLALGESGQSGEVYNVSSGQGHSVRELAERILARVGVRAEIQSDAAHVRAVDVPILVGDNTKLRQATGWTPTRSLDDIIDDLIHAATH